MNGVKNSNVTFNHNQQVLTRYIYIYAAAAAKSL